MDRATGLQNNLNRWYNPKTGRWLSEDPIGFAAGDANLYRYVGNSPTMEKDPTGLAGGIGPVQAVKGIFGHFQDRLFGGGAGVSLPEAAVGIYDDVFENS